MSRLRAALAALGSLGRAPAALLVVACLVVGAMYCANDNLDKQPDAPRGDGAYRPVLARGDGHMHFLITRSLVFDRDVNFDNDLARFGDPWQQPRTVTGRKNVMQQIGPSLIWAPVLAVAAGAGALANALGAGIEPHGYTLFHQRILFATSVLFAWLAIALGVLVARRLLGGRWGPALSGVAVLLGTSLTYYATFMPSYAHAMDAAAGAAFLALWALTLGDLRWRRYAWLGVLLGVAANVRIQDLGFGCVLLIELGAIAVQRLRARELRPAVGAIGRGVLVLAIAVAMHAPQFYVWKLMYGSWLTTPQGPGQMRYGHPLVLELLFSSRNGWLSTHPIAYLGLLGLVAGAIAGARLGPRVRAVCMGLLAATIVQVYFNAVTYEWWSGASFGQRRMCSSTLSNVVGLAVLLRGAARVVQRRVPRAGQLAIAGVVLGFLVAWNLGWVFALTRGAPAGRDNKPTCCSDVIRPLRWIAAPIYDRVGNPWELPASAWFALRHGVGLARWDAAVGSYPLVPGVLGYQDGSYRAATATFDHAAGSGAPYLLDGWGPPQRLPPRRWRWTTAPRAELLLPLLMPEPHRIAMPIAANAAPGETVDVEVWCNGVRVAQQAVGPGWTTLAFDTDGEVGSSTIAVVARVAPYRMAGAGVPWRLAGLPVGVAVGPLRVGLPPISR